MKNLPVQVWHALKTDGALRVADGRYSKGFVDALDIQAALKTGFVKIEKRKGLEFLVPVATAEDLKRRVYAYLDKRGAWPGGMTGLKEWDKAIDTVFDTPLLIRVTNTDTGSTCPYIQMRFLNAGVAVKREIVDVESFNPQTGRWDIVTGSWGQPDLFSKDGDASQVFNALFETFKRRYADVAKIKNRIIRDRE